MIMKLYSGLRISVRVNGIDYEEFAVNVSIHQGSVNLPFKKKMMKYDDRPHIYLWIIIFFMALVVCPSLCWCRHMCLCIVVPLECHCHHPGYPLQQSCNQTLGAFGSKWVILHYSMAEKSLPSEGLKHGTLHPPLP